MKFNPLPWLLIFTVFIAAWWLRIAYIEPQELAIICESDQNDLPCYLRKLLTGVFYDNVVGYLVLALGIAAQRSRSAHLALLAGLIGMAGMVIHGGKHAGVEFNSVGFVLGVLTLARTELQKRRKQHRTG
jgi:hypothetical protein